MWSYNYTNELYHYGVIGMKWGVRKKKYYNSDGTLNKKGQKKVKKYYNQDGTLTEAGRKIANKEIKKIRKNDSKYRRALTDVELKQKVERIKMEKQLKDLTEEDIAYGRSTTKEVLISAGKKFATAAIAGAAAYTVKTAMTNEFNIKEAASYIAANPNKKK